MLFRTSRIADQSVFDGPIPVRQIRRLKFLDAAHIKDLMALRASENPRDRIAGFRLMQLIQGVGPVIAQRVLDYMVGAADPIAALLNAPSPPRASDDWKAFLETVAELRAGGVAGLLNLGARVCGTNRISNACTRTPSPGVPT